MLTKRLARKIRAGITAGHGQARFERQYAQGGPNRWALVGSLTARGCAPTNYPGYVAYWHTLGRSPSTPSNF